MFETVTLAEIEEVRRTVDALTRGLLPGEVAAGEVSAMWGAFAAIERQASAAKTLLAARVAELHTGDGPPEEDLARKAGTSRTAARRAIATSRRLSGLPGVEAALRRGELSADQVDTVADAAAGNPGAESSLLDTARTASLKQLREAAVRAKAAGDPDADATHARIHRDRYLRGWTDPDGAWCLRARGTADQGAMVNAVLEPFIDEIFRAARRENRPESRDAYAFDALLALANAANTPTVPATAPTPAASASGSSTAPTQPAGHGAPVEPAGQCGDTEPEDQADLDDPADQPDLAGQTGGPDVDDPATGPNPENLAPPPSAGSKSRAKENPRFLALLRVDLAALTRGRTESDELCEIAGVGPVPARVARRLLGDAIVKLVVTRGVGVANVTNVGRGPTAAQRVALLWTTPGCTNSECDNTLCIQHDHRIPWADDQVTELHNLDRLCPTPCHSRKTYDGWKLVTGTGPRPLVPPTDPRHPDNTTNTVSDNTACAASASATA